MKHWHESPRKIIFTHLENKHSLEELNLIFLATVSKLTLILPEIREKLFLHFLSLGEEWVVLVLSIFEIKVLMYSSTYLINTFIYRNISFTFYTSGTSVKNIFIGRGQSFSDCVHDF